MADAICKCVCGAEARAKTHGGLWFVNCECGWSSPYLPTDSEAIAAWNRVMRPRPVVTEKVQQGGGTACYYLSTYRVGYIATGNDFGFWARVFGDNNAREHHATFEEARAWLIDKLTAAGFDVAEREEGK